MQDGEQRVRARRSLPEGFSWGPFQGSIHSEPASPGHGETVRGSDGKGGNPQQSAVWGEEYLGRDVPCTCAGIPDPMGITRLLLGTQGAPLALPCPLCTTAVKTQCRGDGAQGGDLGLTQNRCEGVCGCAGVCCRLWGPSRPHPSPLPPPWSRARAAPAQGPRRRGSHLGSIPTSSSSSLPHSFFSLYIYFFFSSGPFIFAELNP